MKLIRNWKDVLTLSWSVRLALLSAALSAAELGVPLFREAVPPRMFATASMIVGVAAAIARVIAQQNLTPPEQQ